MSAIETARLTLRMFTLDDAEDYYLQLLRDPEVRRYLPGGQPQPRERAEPVLTYFIDHWARHGFGLWAVEDKTSGTLIGQCGLQYIPDTTEVEVAYALAHSYWGRGLATEAAAASLRFGFDQLKHDRIVALTVPANTASRNVMTKLGLQYEKMVHHYKMDLACYAITSQMYQSMHP
jgi:ribosomal-protein-alanine N-acetyltransferase